MSQINLDKCPECPYNHRMTNFMNRDPASTSPPWKEWAVQAYIVQELRRMGYVVHGDGNGLSLTPKGMMQKTVCGAMKGWPDLAILLDGGKTLWIELKIAAPGKRKAVKKVGSLSEDQLDMDEIMERLGHTYKIVWATCPANGLEGVIKYLSDRDTS